MLLLRPNIDSQRNSTAHSAFVRDLRSENLGLLFTISTRIRFGVVISEMGWIFQPLSETKLNSMPALGWRADGAASGTRPGDRYSVKRRGKSSSWARF
jgi:hypothetical protein